MNATPQSSALLPWTEMQTVLEDSFSAKAKGIRANTFEIRKHGSVVGNTIFNGSRGAELEAGTLKATIERKLDGGYALLVGEDRILTAGPVGPGTASLEALEIVCNDRVYSARVSFLRNEAKALSPEGRETVTLKGDITGRRYEVLLDPADGAALPGAILLLYHTATFRTKAYLT